MIMRRKHATLSLGRGLAVAILTSFFLTAGLTAAEARRLALVVGNAEYTTVPKLKNAAKDAADVAAALERLGFEVTLLTDVKTADLWDRVDAFSEDAKTADATVFYYAGHAFQMSGVNYLVPVNAALTSREAIRTETWSLDGIIARLQDRKRQTLIFLDACRNDPVPASVRGSGAADGLARIQTGVGTFVAFATEPGAVTYDGAGDAPNSPFTTALLQQIETPGLSVSDMMIKVRNDVAEVTGGRQTPWDQSSLREQFYFNAATETKQELTEADYELLAQLSPEDRKQFLELLAASGFSKESLQAADDAITVAGYNLEVAAESDVVFSTATDADPTVIAPDPPEINVADLEVVTDNQTIIGTEPEPTVVAEATPTPEPEPTVVAEATPTPEPEPTVVAEATPTPEPEPTVVAEATPTPEPEPTVVAEATATPEPEPTVVAEATPTPEPEPTVVAESTPTTSETIASVPETLIASLPEPESQLPLGSDDPALEPPVRLAALSWETRGIVGLNAVETERQRVAGNEVTPSSEENRDILAAIDPALLGDPTITIDDGNLALTAQSELERLGCYRMVVDGSWGKGSRTALTSYFLAKKSVPTSLEPSVGLVTQLQNEKQVVCQFQVARAKVVPGKTRAILPIKASATAEDVPKNFKAKAGRKAVSTTKRKEGLKKAMTGAGNF